MRNREEIYIANQLRHAKVTSGAIDFYLEMLQYFKFSDPVTVTTKQLAINYGRTERSIQRYIRELTIDHPYLVKKANKDYSNPHKVKILSNTFRLSEVSKKLIQESKNLEKRDSAVFFLKPGKQT